MLIDYYLLKQQTSSSTINSLVRPSDNRNQSKSSSALPSTPIRTSSHSNNPNKSRANHHHHQHHRPIVSRNRTDLNGSRTTNTSTNVSPSLNDNNSRTVLLGSDDIRSPNQRLTQVHTDSTADYDEVASHSVDDTSPQTSSESTSMSEVPSESRFKTFVKQKKNKGSAPVVSAQSNRYNEHRQLNQQHTASEADTDVEPSAGLLNKHYTDQPSNHIVNVSSELDSALQNGSAEDGDEAQTNDSHEDEQINGNETDLNGDNENEDDDEGDEDGDNEDEDEEEEDDDEEDEDDAEEGVYDLKDGDLHVTGRDMYSMKKTKTK